MKEIIPVVSLFILPEEIPSKLASLAANSVSLAVIVSRLAFTGSPSAKPSVRALRAAAANLASLAMIMSLIKCHLN